MCSMKMAAPFLKKKNDEVSEVWVIRQSLGWLAPDHFTESFQRLGPPKGTLFSICNNSRDICFSSASTDYSDQEQTRRWHTKSITLVLAGLRLIRASFEWKTRPSPYLPPKSCIPRRAKTTMKRKRRKSKLMIDFMELIKETTRFLRDAQYLGDPDKVTAVDTVPSHPRG